jgi:hypothetical protein
MRRKVSSFMQELKIAALFSVVFFMGSACFGAQKCESMQTATSDELVSYLKGIVPDESNAECITFAIKRLADRRYEPAIAVLARLLDFSRPLDEREKQGLYLHIQAPEEIYPAANAMEEIGKKALPTVLEVIKGDSTSDTARGNAVSVWMELYKHEAPKGVALLKQEAEATGDAVATQNLKWALSRALTLCNPGDRAKCNAAAGTAQP